MKGQGLFNLKKNTQNSLLFSREQLEVMNFLTETTNWIIGDTQPQAANSNTSTVGSETSIFIH